MQVSTWHTECFDRGWACMVCSYSPCFLMLSHLINNWICLSLCNFGQMFPLLLLLPCSTCSYILTQFRSWSLSCWSAWESMRVKGMMLSSPHTQSWMLWKTSDSCFWGFSEGRWRNDLPFELSYWDMSVNYLWLCHWESKESEIADLLHEG